ncbi:MAG: hypothetical protein Q8O89_05575 [Nanoarchaeota archaeon]|nr:hypothetical protein [Nanoarchaeota archaeon]
MMKKVCIIFPLMFFLIMSVFVSAAAQVLKPREEYFTELVINAEKPKRSNSFEKEINEAVIVVILDKYTRNLTWAERPENFKQICSSDKYPDPNLRKKCQIDILEYNKTEVPFVIFKIIEPIPNALKNSESFDCVFPGKSAGFYPYIPNIWEDFNELKIGESYEGHYAVEKQTSSWDRLMELDGEYCRFTIQPQKKASSISSNETFFKKLSVWFAGLFR